MGKTLSEQVKARKDLQKKLTEGFDKKHPPPDQPASSTKSNIQQQLYKENPDLKSVEGYKMEEVKSSDETTDMSSSGVQWFASLFVILIIGLFICGVKKQG